ncbi:MAG TPA: ABC transporter permease [Candidatus Limnocylindria bacterium]|nr:ABC transporter permease [Candidatus Limnocylindria bacterium]
MLRFILRRLLLSIPVLLGVILLVFVLARVIPSDPCRAALQERATDEICEAFNARYGLDEPLPTQFVQYIGQVLTFDLGSSIRYNRPVSEIIFERLPLTMELTIMALLFASVFGILLGIVSAARRNSPTDVVTMVVANIGVSTPVFVLGLILAWLFAVVLRDTPIALPPSGRLTSGIDIRSIPEVWGITDLQGPLRAILDFVSNMYIFCALITGQWGAFLDALKHMVLPMVALGTIPLAIIARMTRSSLLDVMGLDYIRTARAKGLGQRAVMLRHGLRNALLPVVTIIGLQLGLLLSGAVLTETIFNLAGMGKTITEAIQGRDYLVVQGLTIVIAVVYLVINLAVDVSYGFLDPRIRLR